MEPHISREYCVKNQISKDMHNINLLYKVSKHKLLLFIFINTQTYQP